MDAGPEDTALGFCVVANVADWTAHGDGGHDLQRGVRHFAPGAKVWVLPVQWGDGGDSAIVVGHHRGTRGRGYARMIIRRHHLINFRVGTIYSRALIHAITRPLKGHETGPVLWVSRDDAERQATYWRAHPVEARTETGWFLPSVSDPPPMELEHHGQRYYLARFNPYRATYSTQQPPADPP
jgi:hypothetical protein